MPNCRIHNGHAEMQCRECHRWIDGPMLTLMLPPEIAPTIVKPDQKPAGPAGSLEPLCIPCCMRIFAGLIVGATTRVREGEGAN